MQRCPPGPCHGPPCYIPHTAWRSNSWERDGGTLRQSPGSTPSFHTLRCCLLAESCLKASRARTNRAGWQQSHSSVYFQDLCWRAGGDRAGMEPTKLILKIHTSAVTEQKGPLRGSVHKRGAHSPLPHPPSGCHSPSSTKLPHSQLRPPSLFPPSPHPRNRSLLVSGWLEPAEAEQMPGNMPRSAQPPWQWPVAVPGPQTLGSRVDSQSPPRACDLHPPSTISGSGVSERA